MDGSFQSLPVIIPESVYLQALEYLPESITEELFTLTSTDHIGMIVTRNMDQLDATTPSDKLKNIENHYSSNHLNNIVYLPVVCEILIVMYLLFSTTLSVLVRSVLILITGLITLALISYIPLKSKQTLMKEVTAIAILKNIELYTALMVSNRSRQDVADVLLQVESKLITSKDNEEELRILYESALNYFYRADPKLTNDYLHATSMLPVDVIQHEGVQ